MPLHRDSRFGNFFTNLPEEAVRVIESGKIVDQINYKKTPKMISSEM